MTIEVRTADPKSKEGTALLTASHAYLASLYPPEHMFALSIEELCTPSITFWIAWDGAEPLGCVALARKCGYAEVKSMFVDPAKRGRGAG